MSTSARSAAERRRITCGKAPCHVEYSTSHPLRRPAVICQAPMRRRYIVAPPASSMEAHPLECSRPPTGFDSGRMQPVRRACRSAGPSVTPVSAPRIASADSPRTTRSSRGNSSTACSPRVTRINPAGPNGATASSLIDAGRSNPAIRRPLRRRVPARPRRPSSVVRVRAPRHDFVTSA